MEKAAVAAETTDSAVILPATKQVQESRQLQENKASQLFRNNKANDG